MKSLNFETLRPRYPELADLGAFAEQYVYSDPASAGVKLRTFGELLAGAIYARQKLDRPSEDDFFSLLSHSSFQDAVPPVIQNGLHLLRREGNTGAHGRPVASDTASICWKQR